MSYPINDHRNKLKSPSANSVRVPCCKCGETVAASCEMCPYCEFAFAGGCARDYAIETDGKFVYRARRRHLFKVIIVVMLVLGLGGFTLVSLISMLFP